MKNKIKVVIVAIILAIISLTILSITGRTYNVNVNIQGVENPDKIDIKLEQEEECLEIVDTNIKDKELIIKLHSKKAGKAFINAVNDEGHDIFLDVF